jgi:hypothetical protein
MDVNEITDTHAQFTKGDTEIVPGFGEPNIYYDYKANSSESENLLVEMIQSAATPENPRWLGWFYNLTECDFVLMGYYDGKDSLTLKSAFKIDLKKLRAWFTGLKEKMLNKEIKVTSNFCVGGWGITLLMFIPYQPLIAEGIAERIA